MTEEVARRSAELFESGFDCAESVFQAMAEAQGVESKLIPRIATGFCGGISHAGSTCGALCGAVLGIGLVTGRDYPEETKDLTYATVKRLFARFKEARGVTTCPELTGCDLATDAGQEEFEAKGQSTECTRITAEATRIAMELVQEVQGT